MVLVAFVSVDQSIAQGMWHAPCPCRGGGWKKICMNFFLVSPPPLRGYPRKKIGTPCRNFFSPRGIFLLSPT